MGTPPFFSCVILEYYYIKPLQTAANTDTCGYKEKSLSSKRFLKKFTEKIHSFPDLAHSSDLSVQMQEEVFTKSSRAACSCCHCQKQSVLLGLHSGSRRSRRAGKYSGQFSACWIKRLINTWCLIQPLFVSGHIANYKQFDRDTGTNGQECVAWMQQYTNT